VKNESGRFDKVFNLDNIFCSSSDWSLFFIKKVRDNVK